MSSIRADARITDGLTCTVQQGEYSTIVDMPEPIGGGNHGPTPGFHARVGISACIAIGIKLTATRMGLELKSLDVSVDMDFDDSAIFGLGTSTAAPLITRIEVQMESDEDEQRLNDMVAKALEADTYFLALRDPQRVETQIRVVS